MPRILLAEDDEIMRISVYDQLTHSGWQVDEAEDGLKALRLIEKSNYQVVVSDIRMPGMNGLSLLQHIQKNTPETDVIIMTAYGSVNDAIECLRMGAADYILKPFDMDDLIIRVNRLLKNQEMKTKYELLEATCDVRKRRRLLGSSPAIHHVYSIIDQAAPTNATILITGESGTGKELAARAIHAASKRKDKPFVSINCAAIPEGLMESELFGHEKGAFTGADHLRKGKFELADNATLLLDEIGDLPLPLQAKLLRVLQESQFERIGSNKSIHVDVRIIACTSKNLQKEITAGQFRQDLLYRLQVIPIHMAPLREHKEDIRELCDAFLEEFEVTHGKKVSITNEALACLEAYDFPGNARELRNLMERASVLCQGPEITPTDLPNDICNIERKTDTGYKLAENMAAAEKIFITRALQETGGMRTETARLLGISRKNLWEKMKNYDLK